MDLDAGADDGRRPGREGRLVLPRRPSSLTPELQEALECLAWLGPPTVYVAGGLRGLAAYANARQGAATLVPSECVAREPLRYLPTVKASVEAGNLRLARLPEGECGLGARCLGVRTAWAQRPAQPGPGAPVGSAPLLRTLSEAELYLYSQYEDFVLREGLRDAPVADRLKRLEGAWARAGIYVSNTRNALLCLQALLDAPPRPCVLCLRDLSVRWLGYCTSGLVRVLPDRLLQSFLLCTDHTGQPADYIASAVLAPPADIWTGLAGAVVKPCLDKLHWRAAPGAYPVYYLDQSRLLQRGAAARSGERDGDAGRQGPPTQLGRERR